MLRKLIRKEYYDKDFPLNEQEFKGSFKSLPKCPIDDFRV